MTITVKIAITAVAVLLWGFFIKKISHYAKCAANHPDEGWQNKQKVGIAVVIIVAIAMIATWFLVPTKPGILIPTGDTTTTDESATEGGTEASTEPETTATPEPAPGPEETTVAEEEEPPAELPPEQAEDVYDDEYADILVEWQKTASEASKAYLPARGVDDSDEEYKGTILTWLQSEELNEEFIPKDLTEEEAILYVSEFFEGFDINAVKFDRSSMPSSTTRRKKTVREQVQSYYGDPKLEGWSDSVLPSTTFDLFWRVYGTQKQHSEEWDALIAGDVVSAETWKEKYDLEIEEGELDLDDFWEIAFWQPMLYQCVHNPVYAEEKAQLLLAIEKEFPGWLDNAPSVKEFVQLYDEAMKADDGITELFRKTEIDGHMETCVRPEIAVYGINVYLAYRHLEINAKDPVQAKMSSINWHLPPADGNYVRTEALTAAKEQEDEPAINLLLLYKNRKQASEVGVNIFDGRDIIYIAKKPAAKTPTPTPTPKPDPTPDPKPDPTPTPDPKPDPTPTPTPDPNPPGKNPSESILENGNDKTLDGPIDNQGTVWSEPGSKTQTTTTPAVTTPPAEAEKNNTNEQTPANNGGATVDNGTVPDVSKPENRPVENNNSGIGSEPPAEEGYTPPN